MEEGGVEGSLLASIEDAGEKAVAHGHGKLLATIDGLQGVESSLLSSEENTGDKGGKLEEIDIKILKRQLFHESGKLLFNDDQILIKGYSEKLFFEFLFTSGIILRRRKERA